MKRLNFSDVSMPDVSVPDVSMPSTPDVSGITDSLLDFAESAADAISSAAGHVPGLNDYRAASRRRNVLITVGAIAAVLALVAYLKRRSSNDEVSMAQGTR